MNRVLVVDDEKIIRFAFCEMLARNGFSTLEASSGAEALDMVARYRPDAVLLDLKMPGMHGIDVLAQIKRLDRNVPVVIITSHGDMPTAVEATRLGAYDFLMKPPDMEKLVIRLNRAIEKSVLERKVHALEERIEASLESALGSGAESRRVIGQILKVADSNLSVVIQGETGTGKTYIAQLIHSCSCRAKGPFVTVDLGAIPETLIESELFGHEKGAFTGADRSRKGFFETATGGTILLDDIQNTSTAIQGKILRVVEEKRFCPVGSTRQIESDIRIIAATNADIQEAVRAHSFREDLYYRLCEFLIPLLPLRKRHEDIMFFAGKFCNDAALEQKKPVPELSDEAVVLLQKYEWPGNIRELKNVIRRAVLLADGDVITSGEISFLPIRGSEEPSKPLPPNGFVGSLEELERMAIEQTLESTEGNKTRAASILKIDYSTLLRKIKQYGISL